MCKKRKNTTKLNNAYFRGVGKQAFPTTLLSFQKKWLDTWRGNPPGPILLIFGLITGIIMSIPIVYVIWRSLSAGAERWIRLLDTRIPQLLWNTLSLAAAVTICAVVIGISLAWIVIRTDIPGKKFWQWILALPLAIPPYVGAVTYIIVFGRSGWTRDLWLNSPWLTSTFGIYPINVYSFWGVFLILSMFTYPYVYLIASAALRKMNNNFEEAARSLGMNTSQIFWRVTLSLLRPAIGAGAILVSLYVMSDFGAVAMLRYVTFTAAIYFQRAGFDTASAAILSLVLILLTIIILWIESVSRRKNKYFQTAGTHRELEILPLGKWKVPALLYVSIIFLFSVLLPISVLAYWSNIGIRMGALDSRFFGFALNSLKISTLTSLLCMLFALPVVYLKNRYPSIISSAIDRLAYAGYALPGVIAALGFIFIFNNHLPALYRTFYMIVLAFIVRFLPQAVQTSEASISLISPRIDEAARSLGCPPWKVLLKVIIPNMLPGILAGGALVFVSSIKELPVTLMLRPPGFDTLAVRVYFEAHEAVYHLAAPAALLIIIASIIPLRYMLSKY